VKFTCREFLDCNMTWLS